MDESRYADAPESAARLVTRRRQLELPEEVRLMICVLRYCCRRGEHNPSAGGASLVREPRNVCLECGRKNTGCRERVTSSLRHSEA